MRTGKPYSSITFPQANLSLPFLVDSGATYSAINLEISHFASSDRSIQVVVKKQKKFVGILCQPANCSFSSVVPIQIVPLTEEHAFLLSPDSPVNLLGRDLPCKLKAIIFYTPAGVFAELPWKTAPDLVTMCQS